MDKIARDNLVPMSKEELKLRGLKNIRKARFIQLHYADGIGNEHTLIGDENQSRSFGNMAEKWPEYINRNLGIEYINAKNKILKNRFFAEENRDRFYKHLSDIANALEIDWGDGDFPIDKVLDRIKNK